MLRTPKWFDIWYRFTSVEGESIKSYTRIDADSAEQAVEFLKDELPDAEIIKVELV